MIKRIEISEEDKRSILSHEYPKDMGLSNVNFRGLVVNKPWGYEYLMFQTPEVSIWMLYLKKNHSTSMHCHPKKKTSLLLVLGEAISSTLNEKFNLKEKEGLIIEKGVFHATEAVSENGAFIMEIETPTDKTDLFRLKDKYKRVMKAYTEKKNITNKTYNYHYLFLENKPNSTNIFGKYKFLIRSFKENSTFLKNIDKAETDMGILLSGEIQLDNERFSQGEIIEIEKIKKGNINSPIKILLMRERKNLVKLSDYVIDFLVKNNTKNIFLVAGGKIMHLLESIRVNKNINYLCNHHEQAAAMAAEAYARMTGKPGFLMVTSGPGCTNAITGVAGAWIDSVPMVIISGQAFDKQTIGNSGLRQLGVQETKIIGMVRPITKYAVMVRDPKKIKYHLEKAYYLATSGRPGPVWIDIPINIQMAMIEEKELDSFKPKEIKKYEGLKEKIEKIIQSIKEAERPIILLGNGVRLAHAEKEFFELVKKLKILIVTSRNANDLIWENHELYAGRIGSFGQRAGNFAVQNCDLLLSIGSRISLAVTGWAHNDFAREAKKIVVDIDEAELKKPTIKIDISVNCDAKEFILEMLSQMNGYKAKELIEWKEKIAHWKKKYPVVLPEYKEEEKYVNSYYFIELLSEELKEDDVVVSDMGTSFQCTAQALRLKKGQRLFSSSGLGATGFGLPGAIGACIGNNKKRVICIVGDGGLMMNLQELETMKHNNLPIKLFIFNNKGHGSMKLLQKKYFSGNIGVNAESGLSMPNFMKIAEALGIKAIRLENHENMREKIREVLDYDGAVICDINLNEEQKIMPLQGSFNRPDGKPIPRPIEDMFPYVDRDELEKEMLIETVPFDPYKE